MHTNDEMLANLRDQAKYTPDPNLQALLDDFDAMRHDLETSEGVIVDDTPGGHNIFSFPLHHASLD